MKSNHDRVHGRLAVLIIAAAVGAYLLPGCSKDNKKEKEESKVENKDLGKDPHAFKTAEAMYAVGPTEAFDAKAGELVAKIGRRLEGKADPVAGEAPGRPAPRPWDNPRKMDPADKEVLSLLVSLNPYRRTFEVQNAVGQWAVMASEKVRTGAGSSVSSKVREGDDDYRNGNFQGAVDAYSIGLAESSGHWDCRNNLALAELHLGNDLAAQVQLEVLRQAQSDYLPAKVNLTVVYERLGKTVEAAALAKDVAAAKKDCPQVTFNAAWYHSVEGKPQQAAELLGPLAALDVDAKHAELLKLVTQQKTAPQQANNAAPQATGPAFWQLGVAGLCGGKGSNGANFLAVLLFLATCAIVGVMAVRIGKGQWRKEAQTAGVVFFLGCAAWYVLYWGVPAAIGWWLLLAGFVMLGTMMTAAVAKG